MRTLGRVLTAMVTSFNDNGTVDYEGTVALANYLLEHGSDGVVVCGTTGEGATMSHAEKLELFKAIVASCKGKGTIVANVGSNDTAASVALLKEVNELDVDAVMAVVPYYNKPNQEGCYQHFKALAEVSKKPIVVYNVPGRTSSSIAPQTLARLANEFPTIAAVKEASGDLSAVTDIARLTPEGFMIYSGDDGIVLPMLSIGGCGVISVAGHMVGEKLNAMIAAYENGDVEIAREIHKYLQPVFKGLFITVNPIPVKTAMIEMGLCKPNFRLPLVPASDSERTFVKELITEYVK